MNTNPSVASAMTGVPLKSHTKTRRPWVQTLCLVCSLCVQMCNCFVWFFPQALDTIVSYVIVKIKSLIFWDVVGRGCSKRVAMETVAIKLPFRYLPPDRRKAVMNNDAPSPLADSHIYMGFETVRICGRINAWLEKRNKSNTHTSAGTLV